MVDVVDLRIEAQNLASPELERVAEDIQGLGRTADNAQRQVEELEITQQSLASFTEARDRINQLEQEVAEAAVQYQNLRDATRNAADATDEQRVAAAQQQNVLRRLQGDLRRSNTEYRNLRTNLQAAGVNTQAFRQEQVRLNSEIETSRAEAQRLSNVYDQQTERLTDRINVQRRAVESARQEAEAQERLRIETEQAQQAALQQAQSEAIIENRRRDLATATRQYEVQLRRLNDARAAGNLSTGNYIRAESRLRNELSLTAAQANTTRRAIEADADSRQRASANTDSLTRVTRRLAQAYTVLVAAQAAAQNVAGNVGAYGELEAAITNVERTTGIARQQVVDLADSLTELGTEITPTATSELQNYATVAGQLGVSGTEDILRLVAAADALGVSTNIAGDEAATLLTRILQTTGEGVSQISNLSSSVVDLGNNMAVTESEIVNFAREVVNGTREVELGSAASVAFGAALAEAGQRAESSRTALGRLSQSIRRAVTEGGSDLEQLANVTGQTADQLEENLGTRSEVILLDFVRGLERIRNEGGVVIDTLQQFGIDGQEAATVFGALASRADDLEEAIGRSSTAYVENVALVNEASQAYANQQGAIGRLSNRYVELQQNIGEAFSDEIDAAIRAVTASIGEGEEGIINLFQRLPDLISAFVELGDTADNLFSIFGTDGAAAIDTVLDSFNLLLNSMNAGLNVLIGGVQSLVLELGQAAVALADFAGIDIDTTFLDNLRTAINETREDVVRDVGDMQNAIDRLSGESSLAFEDLVETVSTYQDAISRLSVEEQAAIDTIINKTGFLTGEDNAYIELTASIVRANRQLEIENNLNARNAESAAGVIAAKNAETAASEAKVAAVTTEIAAVADLNLTQLELRERLAEVEEQRQAGILTDEAAANFSGLLSQALEVQAEATGNVVDALQQQVLTNEELNQLNIDLIDQYERGAISADEYSQRVAELASQYTNVTLQIADAAETTATYTREQLQLANQIRRSEENIRDLNRELRNENLSKQAVADATARLRLEEQQLVELRQQEIRANELANASFTQLNRLRDQAVLDLERLNEAFRTGRITAGEYQAQQEELTTVLSELNSILGQNTEETERNTQAVNENTTAKGGQAEAAEQVTSAVSLELQAYQSLNQQYDASGQSVEDLNARLNELTGMIIGNQRVLGGWFGNLARISNEVFTQEQAFIEQTLALRRWEEQVQSGTLSLEELGRIANNADRYLGALSDQQLDPLRQSIAAARREFEALDAAINASIDDTQDRLDRILGNEEAIVERRFERERAQLEELLRQAQAAGDQGLVHQAQQALRNLVEAQRLEFAREFDSQTQSNNFRSNNTNQDTGGTQTTTSTTTTDGVIVVRIESSTGVSRDVRAADQESANNLLALLEDFGEVSTEGDV